MEASEVDADSGELAATITRYEELPSRRRVARYIWLLAVAIVVALIVAPLAYYEASGVYPIAAVRGVSMEPLLHTGDLVFIVKATEDNIRVGDIVIYKSPTGGYIIHRVIAKYYNSGRLCLVLWGDNRESNPSPDRGYPSICGYTRIKDPLTGAYLIAPGVPLDKVLGKVLTIKGYVVKIPYLGGLKALR